LEKWTWAGTLGETESCHRGSGCHLKEIVSPTHLHSASSDLIKWLRQRFTAHGLIRYSVPGSPSIFRSRSTFHSTNEAFLAPPHLSGRQTVRRDPRPCMFTSTVYITAPYGGSSVPVYGVTYNAVMVGARHESLVRASSVLSGRWWIYLSLSFTCGRVRPQLTADEYRREEFLWWEKAIYVAKFRAPVK
jgi:hypothetical protein